jgi:hypothetical protein
MKYVPNPPFEKEVQAEPEHQRGMEKVAKGVARSVRVVAPNETGYYKRRVRAVGKKIVAFDWAWHLIEFGSVNNPAYGPLRRGAIAAGLRFVRRPRP